MKFRVLVLCLPAVLLLGGCGSSGYSDLDQYMAEVKARPPGKIPPVPTFKAYKAFNYSASGLRSPFVRPVAVQQIARLSGNATVKPDFDRKQEYLEQFSLDALSMVGSLEIDGVRWALIKDGDGSVHRVRVGNYLGRNHGKIIESNETNILLIEIVSDGADGWIERPRTLEIKTSGG